MFMYLKRINKQYIYTLNPGNTCKIFKSKRVRVGTTGRLRISGMKSEDIFHHKPF